MQLSGILRGRWNDEGGYRAVLRMALPLIFSTGAWSLQQFIDRIFLSWYSPEALAAASPSGMANYTLFSLLIGISSYVSIFVAQYYGANRPERIGRSVWQGLYFSLIATVVAAALYPFCDDLFRAIGHEPVVQEMEIIYFRILLFGAPAVVISNVISGFFSGLGKTWIIFWVNAAATLINIVFDYLLIFGKYGFPEMGIAGAAWATVAAVAVSALAFLATMALPRYAHTYGTLRSWRFDPDLFRRLLRFGTPNGLQIFLEVLAFTIFIIIAGKISTAALAATTLAFNINTLAFTPMLGMMTAVSALVGQSLGRDRPELAERLTWSALHICLAFFATLSLGYVVAPRLFMAPFLWRADSAAFLEITRVSAILLRFVALYSLFDAMNMIFSAAIKGAGDTRYVAITTIRLSWLLVVLPSLVLWYFFHASIYWLWAFFTLYVMGLGLSFLSRFIHGPWREMRVIE
jgi:multidrug resistance protein, MATE family